MADSQRKTANLAYSRIDDVNIDAAGTITRLSGFDIAIGRVESGVVYTANSYVVAFYTNEPTIGSVSYDNSRIVGTVGVPTTFTAPITGYVAFRLGSGEQAMLNTGSQSLPYEPYGWLHSLRKLTTATDTLTTLPAVLYPNDTTATVGISGNTVQNGTPTPQNPIQPSECGDRTENLFDKNTIAPDKFVTTGGEISSTNYCCSDYIPVSEGAYYLANVVGSSYQLGYVVYDSNKQAIGQGTISGAKKASGVVNISANEYYIRINMHIETSTDVVMVNSGSTPLPYEPYGVKIPISSAGTTTPVYLGEVETTRNIKKLVLTGEEDWKLWSSGQPDVERYYYKWGTATPSDYGLICTHLPFIKEDGNYEHIRLGGSNREDFIIFISRTIASTVADFKSYLAAQYANGTPVTVWYVLATPTTGIVNEPIRKIGDYADTVSGITIPTTAGVDSFDVLTTLKPSEVSLVYTGWHDATVKEWDGSQWNE